MLEYDQDSGPYFGNRRHVPDIQFSMKMMSGIVPAILLKCWPLQIFQQTDVLTLFMDVQIMATKKYMKS